MCVGRTEPFYKRKAVRRHQLREQKFYSLPDNSLGSGEGAIIARAPSSPGLSCTPPGLSCTPYSQGS